MTSILHPHKASFECARNPRSGALRCACGWLPPIPQGFWGVSRGRRSGAVDTGERFARQRSSGRLGHLVWPRWTSRTDEGASAMWAQHPDAETWSLDLEQARSRSRSDFDSEQSEHCDLFAGHSPGRATSWLQCVMVSGIGLLPGFERVMAPGLLECILDRADCWAISAQAWLAGSSKPMSSRLCRLPFLFDGTVTRARPCPGPWFDLGRGRYRSGLPRRSKPGRLTQADV